MTNNTIPNVPRELLERAVRIPTKASVEENHAAIVDRGRAQSELRALLSAPSPAGVDGLEVVGHIDSDDDVSGSYAVFKNDCDLRDGTELVRLPDAQAIIDGLRGELEAAGEILAQQGRRNTELRKMRDQQALRIGELEGLLRECCSEFDTSEASAFEIDIRQRIETALAELK